MTENDEIFCMRWAVIHVAILHAISIKSDDAAKFTMVELPKVRSLLDHLSYQCGENSETIVKIQKQNPLLARSRSLASHEKIPGFPEKSPTQKNQIR